MESNRIGARTTGLVRTLLAGVLGMLAYGSEPLAQVNLCPGQFTGRVRIGARDIQYGDFSAISTSPTGFAASVILNGTQWNGTNLLGPLDLDGYTLSVQSDLPGCVTGNSEPIEYYVDARTILTTSGLGDYDYTRFPSVTGRTVFPQSTTIVEFRELNPWILDASVTNLGCPGADLYQFYVYAESNTNGLTSSESSYSQETTDMQGHELRYLDIPLITGSPNNPQNTFTVAGYAYFTGATVDYIFLGSQTVGPADVDANGHIAVHWDVLPECPVCLDANLVGNVTLNGLTPADSHYTTTVYSYGPLPSASGTVPTLPGSYDMGGGMSPGRYNPFADSYFSEGATWLRWPLSTRRDYDGIDPSYGPYVDLACQETDNLDFLADAAWIQGNMTYTCEASYDPRLVSSHRIYGIAFDEGRNPDGSYIGSQGGQGWDYLNPATGDYRLILTAGTWNVYYHEAYFSVNPPSGDPDYPDFVQQYINTIDNRYTAPSTTDSRAIHLAGGQEFVRNFDYEMGKLVLTYTITGNTPAERELRLPQLYAIEPGVFIDPDSSVNPLYYVSVNAYGRDVVTEQGTVTVYLPKGFYRFRPYAFRQLDGSNTAFPEFDVTIGGCVDIRCTVSCPRVHWMPEPDTCGGEVGSVSGTATDPDGWDHIAYRVNHPTPGPNDLSGYTSFTLVPSGGPDNEVAFTAPLNLNVGANSVELEAVDGAGNRYYEGRTVYRSTGSAPTLNWTFPPDGYATGQPTVQVQGSASAGVRIDFVKVNGEIVARATDPGSQNPNDLLFNHTFVLNPGPNTITVRVCDVCGLCVEETRTVTQSINQRPVCDANGPYSVPVAGGHGSVSLDGTGSYDPDGDSLLYSWSTDCPGGVFDDRFVATPVLTVGAPPACACGVQLIVSDPSGSSATCSSQVTLLCDDGNVCNGVETCDPAIGCVAGTPPVCSDGNACNGVETCDPASGCVAGTPLVCDDGNPCTDDDCDPATGRCVNTPDDTNACDDGNECTTNDVCYSGLPGCVPLPSGAIAWWPGDGNANDIVGGRNGTGVNGATFGPGRVAQAFRFNGASWVDVPDDPIWTLGTGAFTVDLWVNFNALSGRDPFIGHDNGGGEQNKWIFWYDVSGHDKLNGVPALRFHINSPHPNPVPFPHDTVVAPWSPMLGRWYHVAVTRSGNVYTLYIDGVQVATDNSPYSIPDPSVPLTIGRAQGFRLNGSVDEVEMHDRALDSSEILAIFNAGGGGKCKAACMPGPALECDDGNPCTTDTCNPAAGCVYTNNTDPCSDGNACTTGDACSGGVCVPGAATECNDNSGCTSDSCNPVTGCVNAPVNCDDGNACNGVETCDPATGCVPGTPVDVDDGDACTIDACDPESGAIYFPVECDDGNACNGVETCNPASGCVAGTPVVCGPPGQCQTAGVCNPATGACAYGSQPNGTTCDDGNASTCGDSCQSGVCAGSACDSCTSTHNPRTVGFWRKVCRRGTFRGETIDNADAACVGQLSDTFGGVTTRNHVCDVLDGDHDHHDDFRRSSCSKAEDQLMALALNLCKERVCCDDGIDSRCDDNGHEDDLTFNHNNHGDDDDDDGHHDGDDDDDDHGEDGDDDDNGDGDDSTVCESFNTADALLDDPSRTNSECTIAECLSKEINNGHSLEFATLVVRREGSNVRLAWLSPVLNDGTARPESYRIWRRDSRSTAPFVQLGSTMSTEFLDVTGGTGSWEYDVTAVLPDDAGDE